MDPDVSAVTSNRRPLDIACRLAAVLLFFTVLSGCLQPAVALVRDDYALRAAPVRSVGVLVPDLTYFDTSIGGVREKNDESSKQANDNMVAAAKSVLAERGFSVTVIPRDAVQKENLEEALRKKAFFYDKSGEEHYNLISALHKSLRGSDPDGILIDPFDFDAYAFDDLHHPVDLFDTGNAVQNGGSPVEEGGT